MKSLKRAAVAAAVCVLPAFAAPGVHAQTYPERPVRVVVPYVAGASYDTIMRIVGEQLSEALKQPVVVENRPGASATMGADHLAKATPDGHTIGMLGDNHTILDNVVVVNPSVQASSLTQLISLLKANPGKYRYGSGGVGGTTHLAGARFSQMTGTDIQHVPYKGGGLAVIGLLGNEVQLMIVNMISAKPQVQSGRVRPLAVAAPKRSAHLPNLQTTAEAGLPGYEVSQFYGIVAPAKTPERILARLERELKRITALPEVRKKLDVQGADAYSETPAEFAAFLKANVQGYRQTVQAAGITAD
jgi:tripartite-type tricarboxylate transporter receptor subunit TctC